MAKMGASASSTALPTPSDAAPPPPRLLATARLALQACSLQTWLQTNPPASPPVVFNADTTLGEALQRMSAAGVISAPVLDSVADAPASDLLGILSVGDIVHSLLKELFPALLDARKRSTARGMAEALRADAPLVSLETWARELFMLRWCRLVLRWERRAGVLMPAGDGDFLFLDLTSHRSLLDVVSRGLVPPPRPAGTAFPWGELRPGHRVAIFDVNGDGVEGDGALRVTRIFAQMDAIVFLHACAVEGGLGELAQRSLQALGWVRRDVVSVPADMPTIAAFALCANRGVSGCGVVAAGGVEDDPLLTSLSLSDIRTLHSAEDVAALTQPVAAFLQHQRGAPAPPTPTKPPGSLQLPSSPELAAAMEQGGRRPELVALPPDATLAELLEVMTTAAVHRVYITDAARRPLGVVTATDVLQLLAVDPEDDEEGWLDKGLDPV